MSATTPLRLRTRVLPCRALGMEPRVERVVGRQLHRVTSYAGVDMRELMVSAIWLEPIEFSRDLLLGASPGDKIPQRRSSERVVGRPERWGIPT